MCCLCIQFIHDNTSERTILHQVNKKNSGGGQTPPDPPPPFQVWLLALQKRLATPLISVTYRWQLVISRYDHVQLYMY